MTELDEIPLILSNEKNWHLPLTKTTFLSFPRHNLVYKVRLLAVSGKESREWPSARACHDLDTFYSLIRKLYELQSRFGLELKFIVFTFVDVVKLLTSSVIWCMVQWGQDFCCRFGKTNDQHFWWDKIVVVFFVNKDKQQQGNASLVCLVRLVVYFLRWNFMSCCFHDWFRWTRFVVNLASLWLTRLYA